MNVSIMYMVMKRQMTSTVHNETKVYLWKILMIPAITGLNKLVLS